MPNRLAGETSPYLLQHADNPVDWHPWGEEALTLARREGKPILLSVGYSACHWCHVMAHESFEDVEVARVMNELFVNVKVDREERPDLDQIYQTAHYMLTRRSGGWPLTMFLTPEQKPFFGGTYFPKESRYGLPGFRDLLERVAEAWRDRRADIEEQNDSLLDALSRTVAAGSAAGLLSAAPVQRVIPELKGSFDMVYGGFGGAPKFPHPPELALCIGQHARAGSTDALHMAALTLEKMALGGIYDQLGGGFCRYSVDEYWAIPHFEKMLYDNGQLLRVYTDAWRATPRPLFERVVADTAGWVMREMQSPEGGYYSSLDADSEHEEGKFYVWTPSAVQALLTPDEYAVAAPHYGLDGPPNFERSHWHLTVRRPLEEVARSLDRPPEACAEVLESARRKLFDAREQRVRPGRDDKVLTSWNALMIAGMARAGRVFGRQDWLDSAARALDFVRGTLWRDGRLLATCKDGRAHLNAYLDDYAFLLDAVLEMLQARFDEGWLEFAVALADALLERFEDRDGGGFFFTSHDHEQLILRPKPAQDQATPSGNGVAAGALIRLGHVLGETRYLDAARRTLELFFPLMERQPAAFASLLVALDEHLTPPTVVILRGSREAMIPWQRSLAREHLPAALVLGVPPVEGLPPTLDKPLATDVNAWVCRGVECLPPSGDLDHVVRVCKDGELG